MNSMLFLHQFVSTRELLLYGVRVTSIFAVMKTPADEIPQDVAEEQELQESLLRKISFDQLNLEQKWMIECRRKFLHYLDAQQIYEVIYEKEEHEFSENHSEEPEWSRVTRGGHRNGSNDC